jgi:hypothetical protein
MRRKRSVRGTRNGILSRKSRREKRTKERVGIRGKRRMGGKEEEEGRHMKARYHIASLFPELKPS